MPDSNTFIELDGSYHINLADLKNTTKITKLRNTLMLIKSYKLIEINYISWEIHRNANTMEQYFLEKLNLIKSQDIIYVS